MDIGKYLRTKMAMLSLALARVEKSALNEVSDALGEGTGKNEQSYHENSLANDLLKGEMTQEVKTLRARMYKVLNASENYKVKIVGYDEDNLPITELSAIAKMDLKKVNKDNEDPYDVELVIENNEITKSITESISDLDLTIFDEGKEMINKVKVDDKEKELDKNMKPLEGLDVSEFDENTGLYNLVGSETFNSRTLATSKFDDFISTQNTEKNIYVHRDFLPKFKFEEYCKKVIVRKIDEDNKLLEFYISQYPDEFDRKTRLLISEIKKVIKDPRGSGLLDIDQVGFVTDKSLGALNGMEYIYKIESFDKIVKHNGCYVLKFKATPLVNGNFIYDKYKLDDLEERYRNKEAK